MNSAETIANADIRAYPPAVIARKPSRRLWPWVLGAFALFLVLLAGAAASMLSALSSALFDGLRDHAHIVINGEPWNGWQDWPDSWGWFDFGGGLIGFAVAAVCVVGVGLVIAAVVVPSVLLALLLGGLGVGLAVVAVVGSVGLVLALVFSPFWLFVLLLWLVFRRRKA